MSFDNYFGHSGLLVNRTGGEDCGDSAQMQGLYRFGKYMTLRKDKEALGREQAKFAQELDILTYVEDVKDKEDNIIKTVSHPGIYVRHPSPCTPNWAGNPRCFSRDQQRSLVVAMGALKQKKKLAQIFWQHIKRFGWYQNDLEIDGSHKLADFAAPDILGEYIRAFYLAGIFPVLLLWPVLFATDLSALLGLLLSFIKWHRDPKDVDDDNIYLTMFQAKCCMPTPISWFNRKLYKYLRPGGPTNAIIVKHREETGSPPFAELYVPIIEKEL